MRVPLATVILSERLVLVNKIDLKRVSFYQIGKISSIKKSVWRPFQKISGSEIRFKTRSQRALVYKSNFKVDPSIDNLTLNKMLDPLGQAWQNGSALAA